MNIKKLKELIKDLPDDMKVYCPAEPSEGFTGVLYSPCEQDSRVIELGGNENTTEEEMDAYENKVGEIFTEDAFVLVPCGFYEDHDETHKMN